MKKRNRRMVLIILSFVLLSCVFPVNVQATSERQTINPRYGERYVSTVVDTEYLVRYKEPANQPAGGYCFPNGGGIIIDEDRGGTFSFSASVGWGEIVPISFSIGYAEGTSGIGGVLVNIPADEYKYTDLVNTFYVTEVEEYAVKYYADFLRFE